MQTGLANDRFQKNRISSLWNFCSGERRPIPWVDVKPLDDVVTYTHNLKTTHFITEPNDSIFEAGEANTKEKIDGFIFPGHDVAFAMCKSCICHASWIYVPRGGSDPIEE